MVYGIIWADRIAPKGVEAAASCKELAIVTLKKTSNTNINRRLPSKSKPFGRI